MNRSEKIQLLKALQGGKINTDRRLRSLNLSSESLVNASMEDLIKSFENR